MKLFKLLDEVRKGERIKRSQWENGFYIYMDGDETFTNNLTEQFALDINDLEADDWELITKDDIKMAKINEIEELLEKLTERVDFTLKDLSDYKRECNTKLKNFENTLTEFFAKEIKS